MLPDHRGGVASGRREMRGVGAKIDRGHAEDLVDFLRPFDDGAEMRMVMRA